MNDGFAHIQAILDDAEAKIAAVRAAVPVRVKRDGFPLRAVDHMAAAAVLGAENAVRAEAMARIKQLADEGDAAAHGFIKGMVRIPHDEAEDLS